MASISLRSITKTFGNFTAVKDLNLEIADGAFVALLGPSGCGKTTTMNMIAGIEDITSGHILFDGKDISHLPVQQRNIGFVFQNYAIFTHLTVFKNLAYGLEVRGKSKDDINRAVLAMAKYMDIEHRLNAKAGALSVNELQKLAIGRSAIVEPSIFLLDEPLSNLDAAFRERMRGELRMLQRRLKQTMVYVTHDQIEAMGLADKIAVMNQGELQQYATPADIYANPANTFVARFIGAPSMNIVPAAKLGVAGDHLAGFRPETISFVAGGPPGLAFRSGVTFVETISGRRIVHLDLDGEEVLAVASRNVAVKEGETVTAYVASSDTRYFNAVSGDAITQAMAA